MNATMTQVDPVRAAERARLVSDIKSAGEVLSQAWPIETFIAVNPLGGFEHLPFGEAVTKAGQVLGANGTLSEQAFRDLHSQGRITDSDLRSALSRRQPALMSASPVEIGDRSVEAADLLIGDLLHGRAAAPPARLETMISERACPAVATEVDNQTSKWCAAFLDTGQAGWRMPGREAGFYAAWRDLAPRDRKLPSAARAAMEDLAERPDDAVLDALAKLGVDSSSRRSYMRAHLTRMPGWSAHVRWHGDHSGSIDLVSLLAMRLSVEAALLEDELGEASGIAGEDPVAADRPPAGPPAGSRQRARDQLERLGLAGAAGESEIEAVAAILEPMSPGERALVWLDAYETHYRDPLIEELSGEPVRSRSRAAGRPAGLLHRRPVGGHPPPFRADRQLRNPRLRRLLRGSHPLPRSGRR